MIPADSYGVHWHDDIAYLHQSGGNVTALGLKNKSPFKLTLQRRCPHNYDLTKIGGVGQFSEDPLVKAMLPLPGMPSFQVHREHLSAVTHLIQMSNPTGLPFMHRREFIAYPEFRIHKILGATNVAPLVISGVTSRDTRFAMTLIDYSSARPRNLCVVTEKDVILPHVPIVRPERTDFDTVSPKDWRAYGNHLIREYMLGTP